LPFSESHHAKHLVDCRGSSSGHSHSGARIYTSAVRHVVTARDGEGKIAVGAI
jgi:hypothetical protein